MQEAMSARPEADIATAYSIISAAFESSDGDTARPRDFAVLRLMINSYFVGNYIGRSAGFSPLRMTYDQQSDAL